MKDRIKKLRKELDLTQQEFADRLGTARNNIAGYETGKRSPSDAVISLICTKFNVNESWLRDGTGEMFVEMDVEDRLMDWAGIFLNARLSQESRVKSYYHALRHIQKQDFEKQNVQDIEIQAHLE